MSRLSLAFLSAVFVYGLSIAVAPGPALAARVNCDVSACMYRCDHRCGASGYGQQHWSFGCGCGSKCLQRMAARKKEGLCK
jgi:hypothetical protein